MNDVTHQLAVDIIRFSIANKLDPADTTRRTVEVARVLLGVL